jgi:hypothetical protein
MAKDIFDRLSAGRPLQIEEAIKPQPGRAALKARLKTLLTDVLANGPAPTTLVQERGAAHGFSRKQLWDAREKMKIVAFKEIGKRHGRWFLALPQHAGYPGTADEQPQKTP